jgi:hypothetical protein
MKSPNQKKPVAKLTSTSTPCGSQLGAAWIASAAPRVQKDFLKELTEDELRALPWMFEFWAMEHQLPPEGDWRTWVILGGRGAGKTRAGSEWIRQMVEGSRPKMPGRCARVALVGETLDQAREVMVFGESGILACAPPDRRPQWSATRRQLTWPNGAVAQIYSASDPESLRGPQFDCAWVDELAKWKKPQEAWPLCKAAGGVEAFCIGSEMRSLTQIRGAGGRFVAVQALRALAADVRQLLGAGTKLTYAADWSEYFGYQPNDGSNDSYFHLDPLWADANIDFIGIDNYMPLSDWRDGETHADAGWGSIYNLDYLSQNVEGGEGYDWYYHSPEARAAQIRTPSTDGAGAEPWIYRYKDIRNWWQNPHYERKAGQRDLTPTDWVPQSKPIWFTEIGCGAVDKGTNEPNKFVDPKSSESALPRYSNGRRDELIQMQYLRVICSYWNDPQNNPQSIEYDGRMLDMSRAHVWA